jgi:hypothetical protein
MAPIVKLRSRSSKRSAQVFKDAGAVSAVVEGVEGSRVVRAGAVVPAVFF